MQKLYRDDKGRFISRGSLFEKMENLYKLLMLCIGHEIILGYTYRIFKNSSTLSSLLECREDCYEIVNEIRQLRIKYNIYDCF